MGDGRSRWMTGGAARAHTHLERARADVILVGRGTWDFDTPKLDVRLPGLERRSPGIVVLSASHTGTDRISAPSAISSLQGDRVLVEGGMATATSFLREDLVDRLLLYRAPILVGGGRTLGDIGLHDLGDAHGRWTATDSRRLGSDRLDVYERSRG
jgi:diaminohydroxyphosphoribosylaminopyrimidine deaminase/5-amino-6-(5-phosphoribosylamino)uracil reductase